jgi:hypothetical protein
MLCPTMGTEVIWHNVIVITNIKYLWLSIKGPGSKEWVFFEDEPPTKVS